MKKMSWISGGMLTLCCLASSLCAEPSRAVLSMSPPGTTTLEDDGDAVLAVTEGGTPYYVTCGWANAGASDDVEKIRLARCF